MVIYLCKNAVTGISCEYFHLILESAFHKFFLTHEFAQICYDHTDQSLAVHSRAVDTQKVSVSELRPRWGASVLTGV